MMSQVELTVSHWVFLLVVVSILASIAFRRGVIIPSILGIFALGLLADGGGEGPLSRLIFAVQVLFRALLNAGVELFDIMLVIALMVAMLASLRAQGADEIMIAPMKKLMVGPWTAFFTLAVTMYAAAAFFWPTPAIALVGTVLIPVAIRVGLPALAAAVSVNLAGHGMALSADPVIQGATRLTAAAARVDPTVLLPYTLLFSFVVGGVAVTLACYMIFRDLRTGSLSPVEGGIAETLSKPAELDDAVEPERLVRYAHWFAVAVPLLLLAIAALMIYRALFDPDEAILGGEATALLGGTALLLLVVSTWAAEGRNAMDSIASHTREGFFFAIKIFAPIIPIAGFFFLGNPDHAVVVLGEGATGFLFDIGHFVGAHMDGNLVLLSFGIMLIAMLTGMDGSGFSGLPLIGSLAGALASGAGVEPAVLAALGQVVGIFTGGGTLVAWAFGACADAGIAGVAPAELVRRNFWPVLTGFVAATCLTVLLLM